MRRADVWQACLMIIGLASGLALAQSRAIDCTTLDDDAARLKCYDEQAGRRKNAVPPAAASGPAAAGATARASAPAQAGTSSAPPEATTKDFGLDPEAVRKRQEAEHPEAPRAPDQIVARVKSVETKPRGQYRITLEDGQVWEETQHTGGEPPDAGETVTIKRGMLGSYFLSRGVGLALRVRRIS